VPQPTKQQLIESLNSTLCPACAGRKKSAQTFCGGCYYDLPNHIRSALYRRIGNGYEQAVNAALVKLDADEFCTGDLKH
jgi:tRNA(Ile2) C34 agmatinyltransferase TiaS